MRIALTHANTPFKRFSLRLLHTLLRLLHTVIKTFTYYRLFFSTHFNIIST